MARPRTVSDRDALDRARACIVEHGPGVTLSVLSRAIGLSPPALIKRFASKEQLVFRALLPDGPPVWTAALAGPLDEKTLASALRQMCAEFRQVGPALAALRMSPMAVSERFPPGGVGPAAAARRQMAAWLATSGHRDCDVKADLLVGAAEARGFLTWVGPQMLETPGSTDSDEAWSEQLAAFALQA